ncbi:MAG: LysR family transcriptional regulator [Polyangiaceae bacterium]
MDRIARPRPRLDVRDLEVVLAIAETGSTVRAAATLHLTQSAVSRALALAEEKLGASLVARGARGLAPTESGRRLVAGAGAALASFVALEESALGPKPAAPVRVRVACECYTAYRWLPSTLAALSGALSAFETPRLDLRLAVEHTSEPVAALLAGELDVALVTTAAVPRGLEEQPLFSDEIVFVVAASHPLARRAALSVGDLSRAPLVSSSQTPDPEVRWFTRAVFGRKKPDVRHLRFPLTEAIIDATRAGMGIAVMSEWIAGPYLEAGDLVVKRLRGRVLERPWRIAYPKAMRTSAARLRAALAHAAPRLPARRQSR